MNEYIRTNIANLRFARGKVSQQDISKATGIGQKTISALETGASKGIEFNTLAKLCAFFRCSPSDILIVEEELEDFLPSAAAMKKADELIARGLKAAMKAPKQSSAEIWSEFDKLRQRLQHQSNQSQMRRKARRVLKVIIDTSVFIAGLLSKNPISYSAQIISVWRSGAFTLVISPQIMKELAAKLYDKNIPEDIIVDLVTIIAKIALHIPGAYESTKFDKIDPGDNIFLAAAYESRADYIVSIDKKSLLPLKHFHRTQILSPELFLRVLMGL